VTPQTARRVARFHVSRSECASFPGGFPKSTWRGHFEWDRKRMSGRPHPWDKRQVEAIERFLLTDQAEMAA
jgi:ribosomal protein L37E